MKYIVGVMMFLLFTTTVLSQTQSNIVQVVDAGEGDPMMGVHICMISEAGEKHYYATDINGKAEVFYKENYECTVSYTGYVTQHLKLKKGIVFTIEMKPDLLQLDQVVVTASLEPQKMDQSIYKVEVISAKEMENQGVQNVRDALRFQPNINLQEDGVLGTQVIMQGLEGQHVKFLMDGMPIIGRQDGNIDLSQIDMSQVDHIEIIEGPMSVVYGSNALAGTINIITKKNKYYTWSGNATAYAESVGQYTGNVSLQGNIGKSKFGFSSGYRYFNGYDLDESTRAMSWNPKSQINSEVFYGVNLEGWETKFGIRLSREDLTYLGNYLQPSRAIDTQFLTDRITYYGQFNKKFTDNSILSGLVSYNTYSRKSQDFVVKEDLNTEEKKGEESHDSFKTLNARLSYGQEIKPWLHWQVGYELTNESGIGEKLNENEGLVENAVWSDVKINLSDHLILQPGIRYLQHNVYKAPLIYSTHLKWNSDKKWIGRLSFAKGFRAPSLKELYMDFVDSNHKIYGNENLTPESSYNITATINKTIDLSSSSLIKFDASGFYNHLYDVIELTLDTDGTSYYYQNISEKKTQGGSFTASYRRNFFKINAGLVLTGIGYDLKNNSDFNFRYATDYIASTSYLWQKADVSMQLDYKHSGNRVQLLGSDENDEIVEGSVDPYTMLNFSTTKNLANNKFSLTAGVKNILDVKEVTSSTQGGTHSSGGSSLIAWGRTFFISLKYNFNKI